MWMKISVHPDQLPSIHNLSRNQSLHTENNPWINQCMFYSAEINRNNTTYFKTCHKIWHIKQIKVGLLSLVAMLSVIALFSGPCFWRGKQSSVHVLITKVNSFWQNQTSDMCAWWRSNSALTLQQSDKFFFNINLRILLVGTQGKES